MLVDALAFAWLSVLVIMLIFFANDWLGGAQAVGGSWQTWVTALGVVGAAFFSVWQQNKVAEREVQQRLRKNFAARASLPTTLAQLASYAEQCVRAVVHLRTATIEGRAVSEFQKPSLPIERMKDIKECIEFADEAPRRTNGCATRKIANSAH